MWINEGKCLLKVEKRLKNVIRGLLKNRQELWYDMDGNAKNYYFAWYFNTEYGKYFAGTYTKNFGGSCITVFPTDANYIKSECGKGKWFEENIVPGGLDQPMC